MTTNQIEVMTLPSRIVHVALHFAMFVALMYVAGGSFYVGLRFEGVFLAVLGSAILGSSLWLELRSPRYIILRDGAVELRSFTGIVVIRDGELISVQTAPFGRLHPWADVSRVIIRFKDGRRTFNTNFPEFDVILKELRSRNPKAPVWED